MGYILNHVQGWGYSISTLDTFLLTLFDKYAELLKHRFSEDFQEVGIPFADRFRMALTNSFGYRSSPLMITCQWLLTLGKNTKKSLMSAGSCKARLLRMSRKILQALLCILWLTKSVRFPCVLPFSQMYPLCCIDVRNFLNQFYFFSDDHFQHAEVIDETLRKVRHSHSLKDGKILPKLIELDSH